MPNKKVLSRDQLALQIVKQRYEVSKKTNNLDWERFSRFYKLFRNRQTEKNYYGLANLFVPEPYRVVRKKTAKLANAIRSIDVTPQGNTDIAAAKTNGQVLNFLRRKLSWPLLERSAIQESRVTGLSWMKLVWDIAREEENKPWKGFDMSFHSADEVLLNPECTMLDFFLGKCRWLIHFYETDLADLLKNKNYKPDVLATLKLRAGMIKSDLSSLEQSRFMQEVRDKGQDKQTKKHKILEYWGVFQEDESKEEKNYLIVVVDDTLVLRMEENPYEEILDDGMPFAPMVANVIGKELYPIGDIEPAESLFNELNDTRNQRMDTVTLNIDPPKIVVRGAQIKDEELIARRGWIIKSNTPDGVNFIHPDMQGVRAAIEEETIIRGDIQQVTGVIDFSQDSNVQAGVEIDTARGAIIAKGESDVITEDELSLLKICFQRLYRIALAYVQKLLDKNFTIRVTEAGQESFLDVTPDALRGNLDLDITMKTLQDKTTEQQMTLLLFNLAKTTPGAKIGRFFQDVIETFKEKAVLQEYYEEPQPVPEGPKVSVSLRGELSDMQAAEVYKTIPGVDPAYADPIMTKEGRDLMAGRLPEQQEDDVAQMEMLEKQGLILKSLEHGSESSQSAKE